MIKQQGIVHFGVLLGIVVFLVGAYLVYKGNNSSNTNLFITPPSLFNFSAYFNTEEGKKIFYQESFGIDKEEEKEKKVNNLRAKLENYLVFLKDLIISFGESEVYFLNKSSKNLTTLPLPEEIKNLKNEDLQISAEKLEENYYLVNFSHLQKDHYTYLYDKTSSRLTHLAQFDDECQYVFCGGPEILKKLSEDDFIFIQGSGDACWSAGVLHRFNLKTKKAEKLFDYGNGCLKNFDSYFGIYENSFIRAKHQVLETYNNSGLGPDERIYEIYMTDLSGLNTVLIAEKDMPTKISYIKLNPKNNYLYLYNSVDQKYYGYTLKDRKLIEITESEIDASDTNNPKGQTVDENNDFLGTEISKGEIGEIGSANLSDGDIYITDVSENRVRVLSKEFLDNVKFNSEKDCPHQKGLISFEDKKFPLSFSSHEYEDSVKALNKEEILFVVISKCKKYLSDTVSPQEWYLGAKQFVLNIKTGEVVQRLELDKSEIEKQVSR